MFWPLNLPFFLNLLFIFDHRLNFYISYLKSYVDSPKLRGDNSEMDSPKVQCVCKLNNNWP